MQTLQLAEALYEYRAFMDEDTQDISTGAYGHLKALKSKLDYGLDEVRAHWDTNDADAGARIF